MKKDKIQEAYEKMLNEKASFTYMGKANKVMANFLKELEDSIPLPKTQNLTPRRALKKIYNDWDRLWDNIQILANKL